MLRKNFAVLILLLFIVSIFGVGLKLDLSTDDLKNDKNEQSKEEPAQQSSNESGKSGGKAGSSTFQIEDKEVNESQKTVAKEAQAKDEGEGSQLKASKEDATTLENRAMALIKKEDRSEDESYNMLEFGYSALLQYKAIDQNVSIQRMQLNMAKILIELDAPELAILHAKEAIKVKDANLKTSDMAAGFAITARAYAAAGYEDKAKRYISFTQKTAEQINDEEKRKAILDDLRSGEWYGVKF